MAAVPAAGSILASAPAAQAEANPPPGTDLKPVLGWSTWSFFRRTSDAAIDEAAARAMKRSGLERLGYRYINQDDFWYRCPGRQGPDVDRYGRWVVRSSKFPRGRNGENGIEVVASYVHSLGLKFGIYVTPGISDQAVARNTPILGTELHRGRHRHQDQAEQLQLRRHDGHRLRQARRPGVSSTPSSANSPGGEWTTSSSTASRTRTRPTSRPGLTPSGSRGARCSWT